MKTIRLSAIGALASILLITSCKQSHQDVTHPNSNAAKPAATVQDDGNGTTGKQKPHTGVCNPYAYTVLLESVTPVNGNYEWVWSVQNSNPGNGANGTVQDMSHWGMQFGSCFNTAHLVSAAMSSDGNNWNSISTAMQPDPSQSCMTTPVLKFDSGTTGANKSYYKVVVSSAYEVQMVPAYYKSGAVTGCCTFQFEGIGCVDITK